MGSGHTLNGPAGRQLRVLIVEDEALLALDYASVIEDAGAQVLATASSADAAEMLAESLRPDVILMNVLGGTRDGIDIAHAIREFSAAAIILVTGAGHTAWRPLDRGDWAHLLREMLRQQSVIEN